MVTAQACLVVGEVGMQVLGLGVDVGEAIAEEAVGKLGRADWAAEVGEAVGEFNWDSGLGRVGNGWRPN